MYRRILVSLDGSVLPDQVVRTAAHLARRTGGTLLLLRAIQARRLSGEQEERDVAVADLGRVAAHADLAGVPIERLVAVGPIGPAVVKAASSCAADLIVLMSREVDNVHRFLSGCVAARVAQASPVPVLILRQRPLLPVVAAGTDDHQPSCWVTVALDGSARAETAAEAAAHLLWSLIVEDAAVHLHLVRVVDLSRLFWESSFDSQRTMSRASINRTIATLRAEAEEYLCTAAVRIGRRVHMQASASAVLTVTWAAPTGLNVAETLVASARTATLGEHGLPSGPCGLIGMTMLPRSGLRRLLGNTVERVVRLAEAPVLVMPPRDMDAHSP